MTSRTNTGGLKIFDYPKGHKQKLTKKESLGIEQAYGKAEIRKKKERSNIRYIKKREIPFKKKEGKTKEIPWKKLTKMEHQDKEEFNFKKWANHRERRKYPFQEKFSFLMSLSLKFVFSLVIFGITLSKLSALNQIKIIFIQFGGVILLTSLYFLLRFFYGIIKELYELYERQKNGIKLLIVFILIITLLALYPFRESIVNSLLNLYNTFNFKDISPFSF